VNLFIRFILSIYVLFLTGSGSLYAYNTSANKTFLGCSDVPVTQISFTHYEANNQLALESKYKFIESKKIIAEDDQSEKEDDEESESQTLTTFTTFLVDNIFFDCQSIIIPHATSRNQLPVAPNIDVANTITPRYILFRVFRV
jgi:hypothetical protein